jgi:hypothetical protein
MINARPEIALRVLIAIEPRAYSQTIDYTVQALRSRYAVRTVDPARLGDEVERGTTDLVLCSMPPVALGRTYVGRVPSLRRTREHLSDNNRKPGLNSLEFTHLLSILDEVASSGCCA